MEAIGARPFRAQAKRREAFVVGESASSDEARYPMVHERMGDGMVSKSPGSYPVRSAGLRGSGRPENSKDGG